MDTIRRIRFLRSAILIHSFIYYRLCESIVDDGMFDAWSRELVKMQEDVKFINWYDEVFKDWDGSTGYHLPKDDWIETKALMLLRVHKKI